MLNLYLVKQTINEGVDTYDSFVCAAANEDEARNTHPYEHYTWDGARWGPPSGYRADDGGVWAPPDDVTVEHIGIAKEGVKGVICASFNAG